MKVITKPEDVEAIQAEWLKLLQHPCNKGIHQSYDWFWAGCQAFHRDDDLHVLLVLDESGKLACVAPLVITSSTYRGIGVRAIGFVRNEQSPANNFIFSPRSEEISLTLILEHLITFEHWELIDLQMVNIEELTGRFVRKFLMERGLAHGTQLNRQSPYILIDRGWEDFWKNKSKKFRKSMRHKLNRATKQDGLVVEKILVTDGDAPALATMRTISGNSWKRKAGTDLSASEESLNFYKKVCDTWGPRGFIHVWLLRIHEQAVAFEFHIEYESTVYPLRADYDENYKEISPGSILEYEIIKSIFLEKKIIEYNSCGHTYDYLMNWTKQVRNYRGIEIFKKSLKMILLHAFEYQVLVFLRKMKFYDFLKKTTGFSNKDDGGKCRA